MASNAVLPGFLATNGTVDAHMVARSSPADSITFAHWGVDSLSSDNITLPLSRVVRTSAGTVPAERIVAAMANDPKALIHLLPPFAAVRADRGRAVVVADSMGFRQVYHSIPGAGGTAVLSTSAIVAGGACGAELDEAAVAVQSFLGWQLGQRTVFSGIDKLSAGAIAQIDKGGAEVTQPAAQSASPIALGEAVDEAAALLTLSLEALLDDHPDAVLQLTGGQDSRILLSAIPPARRKGLRAMTLGVAGDGDVEIASRLAGQCGLRHEVRGLGDVEHLDAEESWELCKSAALRVDGMADPVALASLDVAESRLDQGVRISGLGGEVARGFYYLGRVRDRAFGPKDAARLAVWRMFANEAVEPGALRHEFAQWAKREAERAVLAALTSGGDEWFRATDELYLRHRMQRWAGVTDGAVGYRRTIINPMLDEKFLQIVGCLAPQDKAHSRFLATLQMKLDSELGGIPLEGRPAPITYAQPSPLSSLNRAATVGGKGLRKIAQRLSRGRRAPAGGEALAAKVVEHWRENPQVLDTPSLARFIEPSWLQAVLTGGATPRPSSVAFLTNLVVLGRAPSRIGPRGLGT